VFRWMHIFAGIMWIGLLYYFNFVNGPFAATLDGDTKKKVVPELMPRALYWFRWGAAWTWITGVVLLMLVFYGGGNLFEMDTGWGLGAVVMLIVTFGGVFLYDAIYKSPLGKTNKIGGTVCFVILAVIMVLMAKWGNYSYRGYNIHMGALFGTIMAFNVWFRIWPAQVKIITAIKNGEKPEADLVALAGGRSKHNTYLSLPLIWVMINPHTSFFAGGNLGIRSECAYAVPLIAVLIGWHLIWQCYRKAGQVKGF